MIRVILSCFMISFWSAAGAQSETTALFGDKAQPGNILHSEMIENIDNGSSSSDAINSVINNSISQESTTIPGDAKAVLVFDGEATNTFFEEMLKSNSLIDVIKVTTESFPENAVHIITLGTTLYPDYAQDVYDGAVLAGIMGSEDVLVALLQNGVDPTSISDATAAGGNQSGVAVPPLGAGIGAGGSGGGDTTASTN